jgi:molybdate transport system permease protein
MMSNSPETILQFTPIIITLKLATVTTLILLIIGMPLAWWLAKANTRLKTVAEAVVALPLVLPPTVLGFYLLLAFSPDGLIGKAWSLLSSQQLTFSFAGLVIGSVIYSLPFVVQPLQAGFEAIGKPLQQVAATLGAKPLDIFFSIILPLSRRSILVAVTLGFAHTVGEFGVVLMIGGNIPGVTQVLSITIYDQVESLNYSAAHIYSAALLIFSFVILLVTYTVNRQFNFRFWR